MIHQYNLTDFVNVMIPLVLLTVRLETLVNTVASAGVVAALCAPVCCWYYVLFWQSARLNSESLALVHRNL